MVRYTTTALTPISYSLLNLSLFSLSTTLHDSNSLKYLNLPSSNPVVLTLVYLLIVSTSFSGNISLGWYTLFSYLFTPVGLFDNGCFKSYFLRKMVFFFNVFTESNSFDRCNRDVSLK